MSVPAPDKKIHWLNTAFLTISPIAAVVLVPLYYAQAGFSWGPLVLMAVLWWATGLGITAGYHRLFSHRSYKATWPIRLAYAILGGAAWQNSGGGTGCGRGSRRGRRRCGCMAVRMAVRTA